MTRNDEKWLVVVSGIVGLKSWIAIFRQRAEKIMGAQKFNFAPKFFQNGVFTAPIVLEAYFPTRRKFSDMLKIRGPCLPMRRSHDATVQCGCGYLNGRMAAAPALWSSWRTASKRFSTSSASTRHANSCKTRQLTVLTCHWRSFLI